MTQQSTSSRSKLEFGLSLPNRALLFGMELRVLLEAASTADAEESGFDSIWIGDNLLSKPRFEALVLLSALAERTSRLKLGTVCFASFPLRHPITFAIQWATLDQLASGRTELAVCLGGAAKWGEHYAAELDAYGVKSSERVARLEEGIEILRVAWSDAEKVSYEGDFYSFKDVSVLPKPFQDHVPIIIATNPPLGATRTEERALRRVARLANGWQTAVVSPEVIRTRWQMLQEFATEYGRSSDVDHLSVHLMLNVNDDRNQARADTKSFLNHYYESEPMSEAQLDLFCVTGSAERIAETIYEFVNAGVTSPILRAASMNQVEQIGRIAGEVIPLVRAHTGIESRNADAK